MNGCVNAVQCGCHKGRSTTDHLIGLETEIRKAFVYDEHLVFVFYDLEKAYDRTRRYGILTDVKDVGIMRLLALNIREYLRPQNFRARMDGMLSEDHILERLK